MVKENLGVQWGLLTGHRGRRYNSTQRWAISPTETPEQAGYRGYSTHRPLEKKKTVHNLKTTETGMTLR